MVGVAVSEGGDQPSMKLPHSHIALIENISAAHKIVIVLLSNGNPLEMPWADKVPAILEGYLAGQAGAAAQADILLGNVNPSGKIAETFPHKLEDNPSHPNFPGGPSTVEYRESIYIGYRYYDTADQKVLFPFGHGLSYTTFEYRDLHVHVQTDSTKVALKIKNTGKVPGKEAVQVYVRDVESTPFRPSKELKGFAKVQLNPNEEKDVTIELDRRAFAFYDVTQKDWIVEAGDFEILIGASSRDIRLTTTIRLDSVQRASAIADRDSLVPYYVLTSSPIPQPAFASLYGCALPANLQPQKGTFTLNTPIGDMNDTFIGKQLFSLMSSQVKKMFKGTEEDNPLIGMVESMLKEMPLRSLGMMSNGALKTSTMNALLLMMNGHGWKGLAALIKSFVVKK
jgi:beta-glucosidase